MKLQNAIGVVCGLLSLGWCTVILAQSEVHQNCIFVQAHRGYSARYPENTLLAVERALEVGAERIEMDLAITRDDVIVLLHDRTLDRTTDGRGPVQSFPYTQIRDLDAGSWKSPAFTGEPVPTLADVLELVKGRGIVNLELKTRDRQTSVTERIIDGLIELINDSDAYDYTIVSSFDALALLKVHERDPRLRLLLLDWEPPATTDGLSLAIEFGFWGWSPHGDYATEARIKEAKAAGLSVHVGGQSSARLTTLAEWGVDGFSSHDPETLIATLENLGLRPPGQSCISSF